MTNRIFTYDQALELLPKVVERTEEASTELKRLEAQLSALPDSSETTEKLKEWINMLIDNWAQDIMAMEVLPKGLWTVDFDSGEGYFFCWKLKEKTINHFHKYEEGFSGRKPLSDLGDHFPPPLLN